MRTIAKLPTNPCSNPTILLYCIHQATYKENKTMELITRHELNNSSFTLVDWEGLPTQLKPNQVIFLGIKDYITQTITLIG
jgi:CO dehydrogenase/acetyl-CoA synthase epsilon subunit